MADWRKRATLISGDVVFFEYVTAQLERMSSEVFVWDIDKTYLDTHFETLRGLIKTALEKAFQKRNVPGTNSLVRALTSSRRDGDQSKPFPIYFVSASPPQMEKKIRAKLELDGIISYGMFLKDNLKNLRPKYLSRLNKQVGFKLHALLELRTRLHPQVKQLMWGDDSESDAIVYSIYSEICARRMREEEIIQVLKGLHVTKSDLERILSLQERIPAHDPLERVYINLANDTDPDYYTKFGKRFLATFNSFQAALDLFQRERLTDSQIVKVGQDMVINYGFTPEEMCASVDDLVKRGVLTKSTLEKLIPILHNHSLVPSIYRPDANVPERLDEWVPTKIDYLNDFR